MPLPDATYLLLRSYWCTHRNPKLIFPALGRGHNLGPKSTTPMAIDSVQGAFREAKIKAGIRKRQVSIHTLRHSYATHLLEAGVHVSVTLDDVRAAIELSLDFFIEHRSVREKEKRLPYCPRCGGKLRYCYSISPYELWRPG